MPVVNITLKYFCSYLLVLGAKQCVKKVIIAAYFDAFEGRFRLVNYGKKNYSILN